jgi:threonine/homoserine/homoserine lactone efflux protein
MISALIEGLVMGVTLAFLVGPSFISLIQTSIHRGFYSGMQFAVGIALSDLTLIALSYIGALQFLGAEHNQLRMGIIGGIIVIGFGIVTFTRRHTISSSPQVTLEMQRKTDRFFSGRFFRYVSKGYFMNIFNPFLLIFWLGVMSLVSAKYGIPSREIWVFFTGTIAAVFTTDILKCFLSQRIKQRLNIRVLTWINRIVGLMMVLFGLVLILRVAFFI